jgi:hypothetical protein
VQALFVRALAGLVSTVAGLVLHCLNAFLIESLDGVDRPLGAFVSVDAVATAGQVLLVFAGSDYGCARFGPFRAISRGRNRRRSSVDGTQYSK